METFFFNWNVIIVSYMNKNKLFLTLTLTIKILERPFYLGVNVTLKANNSQAKEIKCLLIQKKIQVVPVNFDGR